MIKKDLEIPTILLQIEAIQRRTPPNYHLPPQIDEDYRKYYAGYRGEKSVAYFLRYLPEKDYFIFHHLRLQLSKDLYFQIDTLILSTTYILLLEIKNISGTLYFDDEFNQLIRTNKDGSQDAYDDPIIQVRRHKKLLIQWLNKHKMTTFIPIETNVVIANSSTVITASRTYHEARKRVIHTPMISMKIEEYDNEYQRVTLTTQELRKITSLLLKGHQSKHDDILKKYDIPESVIQKGVICGKCNAIMARKHGKWACTRCGFQSKDAHLEALKDYALIYGSEAKMKDVMEFLSISSRHVVKRILTSMKAPLKKRHYILPFN